MQQKTRNGYIDVIKFMFAIIIAEFHLGTGIFPGGRIAVEGFFMISSYLAMGYIERDKYPEESVGISTVRFMAHKYKGLFPYLLPSVIIGYIVYSVKFERTFQEIFEYMPLLLFDIFPLKDAGFSGQYVLGISWYLSVMFLALAILYPLCRKFKSDFRLIVCPVFSVLVYGFFSHSYGHIAIASDFIEGIPINVGLLRGLAGSSAGCVLYEISIRLSNKRVTKAGRVIFTIGEIAGFAYLFYAMHIHPKSKYDYVLVFVIFGLLLIGINRLSVTSLLLNSRWTKTLGTWSTLIVLNHYCWASYFRDTLGPHFVHTNQVWIYVVAIICSCILVYIVSKVIRFGMEKVTSIRFIISE